MKRLIFFICCLFLFGCGGGESSAPKAWIRIDAPVEGYSTASTSVKVEGNAGMADANSYPSGTVYWYNGKNSGTAETSVVCLLGCVVAWRANIPLDIGNNTIKVSFVDGRAEVNVSRYALSSAQGKITMEGTGNGISDVTMTISGMNTNYSVRTDESGIYTFSYLRDGEYTVVPSLPAPQSSTCLNFTPSSRKFNILMADIVGQDFTAIQGSTCYSISGKVTNPSYGLSGIKLTLRDTYGSELIHYTDSIGVYSFNHLLPGTYSITPEQCIWGDCTTFVPSSITATIINSNLAEQNFLRQ